MRPGVFKFAGEVEPGQPFAHMIENAPLNAALVAKARAEGVDLRATTVRRFEHRARIIVDFGDGRVTSAALLVAADGARSGVREQAGIATHGWSYGQSAIVTTVAHEREHQGRAEEHFLPAGPFAILPLKGRLSSLVWTEAEAEAARIIGLPDAAFHGELERRFGLHLGEISVIGARRAGRRRRACDPPDCRPGTEHGPARCCGAGRGDRRCGAARARLRRRGRARSLSALAPLRHRRDGS